MIEYSYSLVILILPFAAFVVTALLGGRLKAIVSGIIGTTSMLICCALSFVVAYQYFFASHTPDAQYSSIIAWNTLWLGFTDSLHIDVGILLDPISVMMLVVVTSVSLMVHVYSLAYMKGEHGFSRFFAFLSLFSFSMLGLVVATNLFQMYMFWELVGVSSYLLIGYYYERPSAVRASKKAFIVTRFADLGFLIGILIVSFQGGSFDFGVLTHDGGSVFHSSQGLTFLGCSVMTWGLVLIFMGGAGKSAMFPLHIWLPDAMEGPTPVSALIHAATMVVAGVYLVARLFPLYALVAPDALTVVAWIGALSSLFAAIVACTQTDIKRVLAFSTMSQIGYMMVALGVSGYGAEQGLGYMASMFHLFTHAMFKALLFLAAGAVIHAVHSNEMHDMGGLRRFLPITHATFLVACLAIAGIPPFAGFFSKDEILVAAFEHNPVIFGIQYLVAGLTAFYMFRLYFNIFWAQQPAYEHQPHEAPKLMTVPLILLACASASVGFVPFHALITSDGRFLETHMEWGVAIASVLVACLGIGVAAALYMKASNVPEKISRRIGAVYTVILNKFYIDEVYLYLTKSIIFQRIAQPLAWFDRKVVDGSMNALAYTTNQVSERTRILQSGQLQWYATVAVGAVIVLTLVYGFTH